MENIIPWAFYVSYTKAVLVKCQLCDEIIATLRLRDIKYPITGDMFKSPDPAHDLPDPFFPGCDFEFMRCPYGPHRPMILPNKILTHIGILNIPADGTRFYFTPQSGDDREFVLDREHLDNNPPPPAMSEEEAEKLVRERMKNGKTEIQQGQADNEKPIESKTEAKDITTPFSSDGNKIPANYCVDCDKSFANRGAFIMHMKKKHKVEVGHAR